MARDESGAIGGTSRRTVLKGALSLGAGVAVAGVASLSGADTAQAAPAAAAQTTIAYGAMHSIYPAWVANAPSPDGKNCERRYFKSIPKDWKTAACHSDYVTISFDPDPAVLLAGKLDSRIKDFLATCPNNVELTCWHEAERGNPLHYPANITNVTVPEIHAHMQNLCTNTPDAAGGRVKYGCILVGPVKTNADWLGKDLDWYGIDIYDGPNFRYKNNGDLNRSAIVGRMNENLEYWQIAKGSGKTVSVRITETNSHEDPHRKNWMLWLSEWMAAHNGSRMSTFWGGPDSGTWPPSKTVLEYYRTLQKEFGA
jgi:hypothetical protein